MSNPKTTPKRSHQSNLRLDWASLARLKAAEIITQIGKMTNIPGIENLAQSCIRTKVTAILLIIVIAYWLLLKTPLNVSMSKGLNGLF
jgi:hypothetical protein